MPPRHNRTSKAINRVTLARALSKLGLSSRKQAEALITAGSVTVNGIVEKNPSRWIDMVDAQIRVDDKVAVQGEFQYALFHKPVGVVTTREDELGRKTIYDILPEELKALRPVGRLDKETSGLLVLTNDNQLADFMTSPASDVEKTYEIKLGNPISPAAILDLQSGVQLHIRGSHVRTKVARVKQIDPATLHVSITEGKNRQVRRMMEAVGSNIVSLKRIAIGNLTLAGVVECGWRWLFAEEILELRSKQLSARNAHRKK